MSDKSVMPKVDFKSTDKLNFAHTYSKIIEERNAQRAIVAQKLLSRKRQTLCGCLAVVLGIYAYTISSISQETFLDDFDEPETVK